MDEAVAELKTIDGSGGPDDHFYLMTDALAHWFLSEWERGGEPWTVLQDFDVNSEAPAFRDWLEGLRREGRIRNDDVTLVRIEVM
jgi:hypothetical protein